MKFQLLDFRGPRLDSGDCPQPRQAGAALLLACHAFNPFGGNSKSSTSSSTTDRRIGATDGASVAAESGTISGEGSIAVGAGGQYQEAGSVARDQNINLTGATIETSDPEVLMAALDTYQQLTGQTSSVLAESNATQAQLVGEALDALKVVKQQDQAQSDAGNTRYVVGLLLGGLALVAVVYFWRKK